MPENLPRITVVTPSYNQAQFLEQTILSVIGQSYPNLEYILMDGGSNDGSIDIIKKYQEHFTYWQCQKDNGQSAAINAGFARSTGDILCWLNSDDIFMPGALHNIARKFTNISQPEIVFGNCIHFYENSDKTRGSDVIKDFQTFKLELTDPIIQPSSFWTRSALEKVGPINEELHYSMDWEWFIRAKQCGVPFIPAPEYLSLYRFHEAHKTSSKSDKRMLEIAGVLRRYSSEAVAKAYIKWEQYSFKYKMFRYVVYGSNRFRITFLRKLLHLVFFNSISYYEYINLTPR